MSSAYGNYGGGRPAYNSYGYNAVNRPAPDRAKFLDVKEFLKAEINSQSNDVNSVDSGANQPIDRRINFDKVASQEGQPVEHFENVGIGQAALAKISQLLPQPWSGVLPIPTAMIAKLKNELGRDDRYIYFDSSQKLKDSRPIEGVYAYDVTKLNNGFPIKTIASADIGSFRIPRIVTDPAFQPDYNYFRRVYLDMELIASRQHVNTGIQQRNFIFEFEVVNDGLGFLLIPVKTPILFSPPLQQLNELRFIFKAPYQRNMRFNEDVFIINAVIPAPGPAPADRRVQTTVPHLLPIGSVQAVWVSDYNSANQVLNQSLNGVDGLLADVIDGVTLQFTNVPNANLIATTFTTTGGIPSGVLNVGARRIAFQVKFQTLTDKYTNYIQPSAIN